MNATRGRLSLALGKIDGRKDEVKRELVSKQVQLVTLSVFSSQLLIRRI